MNGSKLTQAKLLIEKFINANKDECKRVGITMGLVRCTYGSQSATIKITLTDVIEVNGTILEPQAVLWHNNAEEHRMEKDWIGKSFADGNYNYTIIGWNPRARKQPVELKRNDGKLFKCSIQNIRNRIVPEKVMAEKSLNKLT